MGNIDLLDPLARVRPAIVVSSHPSPIHNSFPSSAQLHHTNPSSHGKHKMGDKSKKSNGKARIMDPKRVCKRRRREKELDKARRDLKEDYRRNWEMEPEKTKRKKRK